MKVTITARIERDDARAILTSARYVRGVLERTALTDIEIHLETLDEGGKGPPPK